MGESIAPRGLRPGGGMNQIGSVSRRAPSTTFWLSCCGVLASCAPALAPPPPPAPRPPSALPSAAPSASASAGPAVVKPPVTPSARTVDQAIGTAHPLVVEAVAGDGGWVAFCQARSDTDGDGKVEVHVGPRGELSGDKLERYFAIGAGDGEKVQELAAHDESGRWVVVRREGKLVLIDTWTRNETDLSARDVDDRNDTLAFRSHRSLSFDAAGTLLAYLTKRGAVVRRLDTGKEASVDPGPGEVWRMELDRAGRNLVLSSITDDTNGDHRLTWPAPLAKEPAPCRAAPAPYPAWVGRGDTPVTKLAPSTGGSATVTAGYVSTLGDGVVLRESSGRLVLRRAGTTSELSPASCGARVIHADAERQRLVVACTGPKGRPKLELVGVGVRVELGVDIAAAGTDRPVGPATRLVALYPGSDSLLLDLETKRTTKLDSGDVVVATRGTRALVRRAKSLLVLETTDDSSQIVAEGVDPSLLTLESGSFTLAAPWVVNLETGTAVGKIEGRAFAIAPNGYVLTAGGSQTGDLLASGPLGWQKPAPASG